MTLIEISSAPELTSFLNSNPVCLVTFSAHWCGPCRASKPQLQEMARTAQIPFGYTYESDLGDFLHTFNVRAFPTYICFVAGKEVERVVGVNFVGIQQMIDKHSKVISSIPETGGNTLGGSRTAEEARALRLAKLEGSPSDRNSTNPDGSGEDSKPPAVMDTTESTSVDASPDDSHKADGDGDVAMTDASAVTGSSDNNNPVDKLDHEALNTLTGDMGFTLLRAQKGLLFSSNGTVESAVEWLMEHQDDVDIDEPIADGAGPKAQSYKCNECGRVSRSLDPNYPS